MLFKLCPSCTVFFTVQAIVIHTTFDTKYYYMKRLLIAGIIALLFTACKKNNDVAPTYSTADGLAYYNLKYGTKYRLTYPYYRVVNGSSVRYDSVFGFVRLHSDNLLTEIKPTGDSATYSVFLGVKAISDGGGNYHPVVYTFTADASTTGFIIHDNMQPDTATWSNTIVEFHLNGVMTKYYNVDTLN